MELSPHVQSFFISPNGNDAWSGRLPDPSPDGLDGPYATLHGAREALSRLKKSAILAGPLTVWVRAGRYPLKEPVLFNPEDSWPITYAAYPGENPVFDGGERITGWREEKIGEQSVWVVDLPEAAAGTWYFRSLFVNDQRRSRARLPKVGPNRREFFWMESVPGLQGPANQMPDFRVGQESFVARAGDFETWRNLQDVEVVALHFWVDERMPVKGYDPQTRTVTSRMRSIFRLSDDYKNRFAKYYIDNVYEGLSEAGEWYLDRSTGRLYYLPLPGESLENTEIFAPRILQFLKLVGKPEDGQWVEYIRFEGLTFEHTDWTQPISGWEAESLEHQDVSQADRVEYAASPQAAVHVPGAIFMEGTRYCAVEDCTVRHVGWYGIELAGGCEGIRLVGNKITDLGAGGVKVNGSNAYEPLLRRTGKNVISDNEIGPGGLVFHSAIGVLLRNSSGNKVTHNHIHDFYYSAVSCGWVWGYDESVSHDNAIEKNHIHHLGFGWLSDMGGVYTLGVQPGTTICGNYIHDVESASYGGWAIYPDEGSSHLLIENNVCHSTSQQPFHEHYGRENIIRNNIFAFGKKAQIALSRGEHHRSFTFSKNIILTHDQPVFTGGYGADLRKHPFGSDLNLFWSTSGSPLTVSARGDGEMETRLSWEEWLALGFDRHSIVADPCFEDLPGLNFKLRPNSPAFSLGFVNINLADVGPRPKEKRG